MKNNIQTLIEKDKSAKYGAFKYITSIEELSKGFKWLVA